MNIYRALAENVWNPRISSGADIQRQLDLMDRLQATAPQSNINYALAPTGQMVGPSFYGEEDEGRRGRGTDLTGIMAEDPHGWQTLAYGLFNVNLPSFPRSVKEERFPSPFGKLSGLPSTAMSYFMPTTPAPIWGGMWRNVLNPLASYGAGAMGWGSPSLSKYATSAMSQSMRDAIEDFYGSQYPQPSALSEYDKQVAALAQLGITDDPGSLGAALGGWAEAMESGFERGGVGEYGGGTTTGW